MEQLDSFEENAEDEKCIVCLIGASLFFILAGIGAYTVIKWILNSI